MGNKSLYALIYKNMENVNDLLLTLYIMKILSSLTFYPSCRISRPNIKFFQVPFYDILYGSVTMVGNFSQKYEYYFTTAPEEKNFPKAN